MSEYEITRKHVEAAEKVNAHPNIGGGPYAVKDGKYYVMDSRGSELDPSLLSFMTLSNNIAAGREGDERQVVGVAIDIEAFRTSVDEVVLREVPDMARVWFVSRPTYSFPVMKAGDDFKAIERSVIEAPLRRVVYDMKGIK